MKIRSITYFMEATGRDDKSAIAAAGEFTRTARQAFEQAGYEVQTLRLATGGFGKALQTGMDAGGWAAGMEAMALDAGFGYVSLGPAYAHQAESFAAIAAMMAATEHTFFSGMMTEAGGISLWAVKACGRVIEQAAVIEANGFANLRFTASANMPAGSPFFPAGYHGGGGPSFAIASEAADLAVGAFGGAATLEQGQKQLRISLEEHGRRLSAVGERLARAGGAEYGGIDFSLAPFPEEALSIGVAFERMGVSKVGRHGSLAAAAILTDVLERADFKRAGFSGLLLPMLEDSTLAKRGAEGTLTIKDLLVYSAVCGTGLDTIPVPGDTSAEQLSAVLLDVAALSQRLGKPLTARLMPVPGKKAGDTTAFDFAFFANSRVLAVESDGLGGLLSGDGVLEMGSIRPRG